MKYMQTDSLSEKGIVYIAGYESKGLFSTKLVRLVEKLLGFSLSKWGESKKEIFEGKEGDFLSFDFYSKDKNIKLILVSVDDNYLKMQHSLYSAIKSIISKEKAVVIDVEGITKKLDLANFDKIYRLVEAIDLATYHFDIYKSKKSKIELETIGFFYNGKDFENAKEKALIVTKAVKNTRDFVNTPAMDMNPDTFLRKTKELVKKHSGRISLEILDTKEMKKRGMNALLAVGEGSQISPKCFVLIYQGNPKSKQITGWIGKGVTFDSGGLDIKPTDSMATMKCDMAGAATVLFATEAVVEMRLPINLVTVIPCVENMPSGNSYKPGDVLRAMNGKTIEVGNTDAEGRLILADALVLAAEKGANQFIDVATLTGACVVALGEVASGLCGNDDQLASEIISAGLAEGEKIWQMPMFEEYRKLIDSEIADINNSGGRMAGMITAAFFLKEFVPEKSSWCHLDIAGTAFRSSPFGISPKGATGEIVRTLLAWVQMKGGN